MQYSIGGWLRICCPVPCPERGALSGRIRAAIWRKIETEDCRVARGGQWRIFCSVLRLQEGQWRIFCSAVRLHEEGSFGSSVQGFGYTRTMYVVLLCIL